MRIVIRDLVTVSATPSRPGLASDAIFCHLLQDNIPQFFYIKPVPKNTFNIDVTSEKGEMSLEYNITILSSASV
ncbi:hypothetical protein CBS63078_8559 [Aspergillus niger]|nr:hypothetical protein CBS115989_5547 [Aspergillus niger]KAI2827223.1 hypothetical protein CBS133816_6659 [Aspergillus niger]KAI2845017.1 hypothetical protein CBS11232_7858 [Aspergillus niger]KAI2847379.1 hypothetical protein CBS12448_9369 [Aspergillus niger]KAI2872757.1 hypothetical protein CBS115988_7529 [Aspergillus niger]